MAHAVTSETTIQNALDEEREISRGSLVVTGIIFGALGAAAIVFPFVSSVAVTIVIGALMAVAGATQLWRVARRTGAPQRAWRAAMGAAWLGGGVLFLLAPIVGVVSLTILAAALIGADGVVRLTCAARQRDEGRAWLTLGGILSLALAAIIAIGLPASALWALGVLVGVSLLFDAFVLLGASLTPRHRAGPS